LDLAGNIFVATSAITPITAAHTLHVRSINSFAVDLKKLDVFAYPLLIPTGELAAPWTSCNLLE
jgi:hypothetical protein